jgi:hypothetical protein
VHSKLQTLRPRINVDWGNAFLSKSLLLVISSLLTLQLMMKWAGGRGDAHDGAAEVLKSGGA